MSNSVLYYNDLLDCLHKDLGVYKVLNHTKC